MADLSITAANVTPAGTDVSTKVVQVAETVTGGDAVIQLPGEAKWRLADANAAANTEDYAGQTKRGVAMTGAGADGFVLVLTKGQYVAGATLTVGMAYIFSNTPGNIAPVADFSGYSDAVCTIFAQAVSTTVLQVFDGTYTGANNITP